MSLSPIYITKIKETAGIHYYFISTHRGGFYEFCIGIQPKNNKVYFYNNNDLETQIGVIDFNIADALKPIGSIPLIASNRVALQAYRAIQKNDFPADISVPN